MLLRGRDDDAVMVWFAYLLNNVVVCGLLCSHEISAFADKRASIEASQKRPLSCVVNV